MSVGNSIIWRRLDCPGHEFARIFPAGNGFRIEGAAIFIEESELCKLDYAIECDAGWRTESAKVSGFVGAEKIEIEITVDAEKNWRLNGETIFEAGGCTDIDLNFSPVTNTLPIRRLNLASGEKADVRAAWLRFPSFRLETLAQVYERTGENTYRYESGGGSFASELALNGAGFVVNYGGLWEIETDKS
ncbi:MAG TPA: putative glycolipid-binding domain-containing protein [Pyrinomonadaceae bacterium]|jgi:hypothetical protein